MTAANAQRFERMEKLAALLNERVQEKEVAKDALDACCDEAGLGIVSAPEAWFYDRVEGPFGGVVLLFRQEYHDNYDFVIVRDHYNSGWTPGPRYIWQLFPLPHYVTEDEA